MQGQIAGHLRATPLCSEAIVGAVDAEIEIPNRDAKTASQHHGQTDRHMFSWSFNGPQTARKTWNENERQKRPHEKNRCHMRKAK
jgi:hypothetical protein